MSKEAVTELKALLDRVEDLVNDLTKEEENEIDKYLDEKEWPPVSNKEDSGPSAGNPVGGVLALP
jgi:hypothetical protein